MPVLLPRSLSNPPREIQTVPVRQPAVENDAAANMGLKFHDRLPRRIRSIHPRRDGFAKTGQADRAFRMIIDDQDSLVFQGHPPYLGPPDCDSARRKYLTPESPSQRQDNVVEHSRNSAAIRTVRPKQGSP